MPCKQNKQNTKPTYNHAHHGTGTKITIENIRNHCKSPQANQTAYLVTVYILTPYVNVILTYLFTFSCLFSMFIRTIIVLITCAFYAKISKVKRELIKIYQVNDLSFAVDLTDYCL